MALELNMDKSSIQTHALKKDYPMGDDTVHALRGIALELQPGEFLAIMGPSGSGKSTLLHLLAGLDTPSDGRIEIGGRLISSMTDKDLTLLRRRKIGVIFQFFNLLPNLTALENVALPLLLDGKGRKTAHNAARGALTWVGLGDREKHTADRLSGGEQQRVALARAMVFEPELILADEPTGNLDRATGEQVLTLFRKAANESTQTIVMVTHDPLAAVHADRILFLADGRVVDELHSDHLTVDLITHAQANLQD
jgi:putative ABC transport system ATP-binding protein